MSISLPAYRLTITSRLTRQLAYWLLLLTGCLLLAGPLPRAAAQAYTSSTYAGTGTAGYGADGGPATSSQLAYPYGVAADAAGNVYLTDRGAFRIRRVSPVGVITTIAGTGTPGYSGDGGPATSAQLNNPGPVALDATGNLYISDTFNGCIRRVSPSGLITTIAGTGTLGYSGDGGPATSAQLDKPYGLAVDAAGNVYVADVGNHRIRRISPAGVITTVAGTGAAGFGGDGGPATSAALNSPYGVALDAAGTLYLADSGNQRIRRVSAADGTISTLAGTGTPGYSGDGGPATGAQLNDPEGLTLGNAGSLYLADRANHCVRRVSPAGIITTIAGTGTAGYNGDGGPATSAQLSSPNAVALDAAGNVYVSDFFNHRIRRLAPVPVPTLTRLSASRGPVGKLFTLSGTDFTGATTVRFNGVADPTFSVVDAETITATVPAGASTGPVTVTTPGGTSNGLPFTVLPAPANDDCAGATSLPVVTRCTSPTLVDTEAASASAGVADPACGNYQGGDVWYTVTVPANGVVTLETSAVPGGSRSGLAAYSGSCGSLTELTCDETSSYDNYSYLHLTGRPAGEVLYVRAWVPGSGGGRFGLCATTDDGQPTLTWTGVVSTDWFTAGNWNPAQVPTAATNAWVPEDAPNWPIVAGGTAQVRSLSFDKYAEFQLSGGTLAVAGDLRNRADAGHVRFRQVSGGTATGGVLAFVGTTAQQVAGLGQVYHLRVATGGSTVTLHDRVQVFYRLTMAGGLLDTGPGWVELWRDTDLTNEFAYLTTARLAGESETSYVQGRILTLREVSQGVREDFSGLGMTQFTTSTTTPGLVVLNRYTGTPQPDVGGQAGIGRTYVAQADQDTGLNLTLDVHYFAHELNGLADNSLRPYSSPLDGNDVAQPTGPWTLEAPSRHLAPVATDSASTVRLTDLTHLSAWTLGAAAAPLPVQLVAFAAEASGPDGLLRWTTASELRNAYFAVESSSDGRAFAEVGRVAGAGSSASTRHYQLRDADLARYGSPVVYYRLRQVDTDGTATYSPVRTLAVAAPAAAPSAYPNPYTQALTVRLPAPAATLVQLVLRDALGREVLRYAAPAGAAEVPLPGAERLPAGLYLLGVTVEGQTTQLRVSRQ